jgi:hypothetical protein
MFPLQDIDVPLQDIDVPLPRPSQRKRKWGQRQRAILERAKGAAAAADVKPVSDWSKSAAPRHIHTHTLYLWMFPFGSMGRVDLGRSMSELLCFLICDSLPCRSTVK